MVVSTTNVHSICKLVYSQVLNTCWVDDQPCPGRKCLKARGPLLLFVFYGFCFCASCFFLVSDSSICSSCFFLVALLLRFLLVLRRFSFVHPFGL